LKNIGHQTATIVPGNAHDYIDFGQTANALIASANVISLPAMATITLMAYGTAPTAITLHDSYLEDWDTSRYPGYTDGSATGAGWMVISQTG
jgi:hypothetical protein